LLLTVYKVVVRTSSKVRQSEKVKWGNKEDSSTKGDGFCERSGNKDGRCYFGEKSSFADEDRRHLTCEGAEGEEDE